MKKITVPVLLVLVLLTGPFASDRYAAAAERFVNHGNGTVTDTQTGLMWAARDNGSDINWFGAKSYCEGFSGGGQSGWRMPTQDELVRLYQAGVKSWEGPIKLSGYQVWAIETRTSIYGSQDGADVYFVTGSRGWFPKDKARYNSSDYSTHRALPVRNVR
jgi:hypothetical protein